MSDQTDEQKEIVHKDAQTPQTLLPTQPDPSSPREHCPNCEAEDVHAESVSISARALKDLEKRLGQTQIIQSSFILVAFVLGWLLANLDGFELKKSSKSSLSQSATSSQTSTQGSVSGEITDDLVKAVLPPSGVRTGLSLGDLGSRVVASGTLDMTKLEELYSQRGGFQDWQRNFLTKTGSEELALTQENAQFLLNFFWAVGLANKNLILEEGQMKSFGGNPGQFASTGGWTLGSGKGMDHYSKHALIPLNASQQELVKKAAENIYRPCCGNSTAFPDCNHGMALLGVLELAASQGFSEGKMYDLALAFNSFWFPDEYVKIAQYLKSQGKEWSSVDVKEVLGREYSSSSGLARVNQALQSQSPTPGASQQLGGGGCGV